MKLRFQSIILSFCLLPVACGAQVQVLFSPAKSAVTAVAAPPAPVDLSGAKPKPFDRRMAAQLDAYIADLMQRDQVPGVAVAIVQNGKTVYSKGFGVRELGKPDRVTSKTLMMIGSTGKSMTTLMMATLVDDGKIAWDTPAVQIYPDFAVSDPKLTPRITMRDLVCNCTGIQRHDLGISFASRPSTPAEVIHSLRTFSFAGEFGKTFGYSNQMVGTGGYIAARAAGAGSGDLYTDYLAQMQKRVFDPIGMASTTFSFERVQANPDHATPHGLTAAYVYVPIALDLEKPLQPFAPAGVSWSNVEDMARYLITQLNRGVAPNGRRVVSAENLKVTWQPQVEVSPGAFYGLGWGIGKYKGQRVITHGGGTAGFSSDLTFLPDANLGIVVLTNAQNANLFGTAVRSRVLELAFGQPRQMDGVLSARLEQTRRRFQDITAKLQPLDVATAAPYQGVYTNAALGEVKLVLLGGKLRLDAGGFIGELRRMGEASYVLWDPPLAGGLIQFTRDGHGQPMFVYNSNDPDEPDRYSFTKVSIAAAIRPASTTMDVTFRR